METNDTISLISYLFIISIFRILENSVSLEKPQPVTTYGIRKKPGAAARSRVRSGHNHECVIAPNPRLACVGFSPSYLFILNSFIS